MTTWADTPIFDRLYAECGGLKTPPARPAKTRRRKPTTATAAAGAAAPTGRKPRAAAGGARKDKGGTQS